MTDSPRSTEQDMRDVLTELLRLYDWRFELAQLEREYNERTTDNAETKRVGKSLHQQLRHYGEQKKATWQRAREVLARSERTSEKPEYIIPEDAFRARRRPSVPSVSSTQESGSVDECGVEMIRNERIRQILRERWSAAHDDEHEDGELVAAAICYATPNEKRDYYPPHVMGVGPAPKSWPWDDRWWKPDYHDRVHDLVRAGALIAAEIDRLLRAERAPHPVEQTSATPQQEMCMCGASFDGVGTTTESHSKDGCVSFAARNSRDAIGPDAREETLTTCDGWSISFNAFSHGVSWREKLSASPTDDDVIAEGERYATEIFPHEVCDSGERFNHTTAPTDNG